MTEAKTVQFSMPGGTGAASVARRSVISIEAGLPLGVRHRVALMLSELVANAVQHGGAGPDEVVEVRVRSSRQRVRVEVLDPGWGGTHPPERIQHPDGGSLAWFELALDGLAET